MTLSRILVVLLLSLLPVSGSWADGDTRPATGPEKACMKKVLDLFVRCSAKGPTGWTKSDEGDASVPDAVSGTSGNKPIALSYEVTWADQARIDQAEKASMDLMMKSMSAGPSKAQEADQEKLDKLMAQINAAAEKGDYAKIQTLQPEIERLSKSIGSAQEKQLSPGMDARIVKDARIEISFETNTCWVQMSGRAVADTPLQGATVYRVNDEGKDNYGWHEGTTYAVLGPMRLVNEGDSGYLQCGERTGAPCKVLTLVISVRAEKARARKFLEGLDWGGLKGLLQ